MSRKVAQARIADRMPMTIVRTPIIILTLLSAETPRVMMWAGATEAGEYGLVSKAEEGRRLD